MPKPQSFILKFCNGIIKYSIFTAIFLTPILFLPWTSDILDFNKQAVLLVLTLVAFFAWVAKVLFLGKFEISANKLQITIGALLLAGLFSTIFSVYKHGSFWGWPQSGPDSLVFLIIASIVYFLVNNNFAKKDIFSSVVILSVSALIAEIFAILQFFGLFILPFDFAKNIAFNTIGSVGALGIFAGTVLPLSMILLIISKKWWKILFAIEIVFSALVLLLINFSMIWIPVIAGSVLIMIFGVLKKDLFDGRWLALPMFFLAVATFFAILNPQIPGLAQKSNEIYLNNNTSLKIIISALKEKPTFGSGLGTFYYDFLKFKSKDLSEGSLWGVGFTQATSKVLTDLATTGIVGLLALLAFIGFSVFYGVKFLSTRKVSKGDNVAEKEQSKIYWLLTLGLTSAIISEGVAYFLYNGNITLNFVWFLLIACLATLIFEDKKQFELKYSSLKTLAIIFVFTLVSIFGVWLLLVEGQRYVAETTYFQGLTKLQNKDLDGGVKAIELSASMSRYSDLYFRQLSQLYLVQLQGQFQNVKGDLSEEQKNKIQVLVANAVNAAKITTDINPQSAINWSNRGYVYQNLFGLLNGAEQWAIDSYESALKLDPNNPYLFAQEGNINFILAIRTGNSAEQKAQLLNTAKEKLEKSVSLDSRYANGFYSLGLIFDALGQKDKAIEMFKKVQQLNPRDTSVSKIISNLNAGLPALQSPTPPKETPPAQPSTKK